ncbi:MAG: dihydrodipicolinate synthase family protein, partial [Actinomycetota bacterium]
MHLDLLDIFYGIFIASNPVPIKEALNLKGINVGPCRLPLSPMEDNELQAFKAILKRHKIIS